MLGNLRSGDVRASHSRLRRNKALLTHLCADLKGKAAERGLVTLHYTRPSLLAAQALSGHKRQLVSVRMSWLVWRMRVERRTEVGIFVLTHIRRSVYSQVSRSLNPPLLPSLSLAALSLRGSSQGPTSLEPNSLTCLDRGSSKGIWVHFCLWLLIVAQGLGEGQEKR